MPKAPAQRERVYQAIAQLQRLVEVFQERRAQLASQVGLTDQQWSVLEGIATEHFIPSLFAKKQDSSAPAISRVLRQLLGRGLISVTVSPDDGRNRHYVLAPKGKRLMQTLRKEREHAIDATWCHLDAKRIAAFADISAELAARLEHYASQTNVTRSQKKDWDHGKEPLRKSL